MHLAGLVRTRLPARRVDEGEGGGQDRIDGRLRGTLWPCLGGGPVCHAAIQTRLPAR